MKEHRAQHKNQISAFHRKLEENVNSEVHSEKVESTLPESNAEDIENAFGKVVLPKKRKFEDFYKTSKKQKLKDDNYIPYVPSDKHTEEG